MILESIKAEYQRYRSLVEGALSQIDDTELNRAASEDGNSVAVIINHLSGNLRSRFTNFLTEDGEKPWRDRDREFETKPVSREELMRLWTESLAILDGALGELSNDKLERTITIRGQKLTVIDALHRSLAHFAYHAGQIVMLCRGFRGRNWRSLSIPRGESKIYNQNPTREKFPGR